MKRAAFDWLWLQAEARVGEDGVTEAQHALQTAHLAMFNTRNTHMVVAALVHDLGKPLNEVKHGLAISVCFPNFSFELRDALANHEVYVRHVRQHPDELMPSRLGWRLAAWDAAARDPSARTPGLQHFLPLLEAHFDE